jgi:hypothetical protein
MEQYFITCVLALYISADKMYPPELLDQVIIITSAYQHVRRTKATQPDHI